MAEQENAPREQYTLGPTKLGHHLQVNVWQNGIFLNVQTQVMNLAAGEAFTVSAGQIGIITGATLTEAIRFATHSLAFFQDPELAELGVQAVQKLHATLNPPQKPPPSIPPARGMN